MSLSSGTKTAVGEAASWLIAGVILVGTFLYYDELKAAFLPSAAHLVTQTAEGQANPAQMVRQNMAVPTGASGYRVELAADESGHFRTAAQINGRPIDVLVDTGATYVGLTYEDAERAGIFVTEADFRHKVQTANGYSRIAVVMIDRIAIGDIEVRNVKATVAERGKLHITLLGMSFLGTLQRTEMQRGRLMLEN